MSRQVREGGSQDIRRLEVWFLATGKTPAPLADLQIQNMYKALGTGEDEQDLWEDSSEPSEP